MEIADFQEQLRNYDCDEVVQACIFTGQTYALSDIKYTQLRRLISEKFEVDPLHVYMVGSGKLGFSIKPSRRYGDFNDQSDIDLAIISPMLFEKVWKAAYLYSKTGAYWPAKRDFFAYLSEGWIRPDKFPSTAMDPFFQTWWDFFRELSRQRNFGDYPIRAGIYQSRFFLEEYQKICIRQCKEELK